MNKRVKRFLVALALFLLVTVSLLGLSGAARATSTKALPATATPVTLANLGLGLGTCYLDGTASIDSTAINTKSCVGIAPPPAPGTNCNPKGLLSSTLDVEHDVRDEINIGGFATLELFYSLGCGSVWAALKVNAGCHAVTGISITDTFHGNSEGGLDGSGVLKCGPSWESSYMVDGEAGSTATASVNVDFVNYPSASVTV